MLTKFNIVSLMVQVTGVAVNCAINATKKVHINKKDKEELKQVVTEAVHEETEKVLKKASMLKY